MKKAFTLVEMLVAVAVLAVIASFASVIFKVCIDSHRVTLANAEIMQKLRAITDQLNADFKGLRKDGEIFVAWLPIEAQIDLPDPRFNDNDYDGDGFIRYDRIMFFANGDFQSYHQDDGDIRGNVARISYMLAKRPGLPVVDPCDQAPGDRILARTQHILTADMELLPFVPDDDWDEHDWYDWGAAEYDKTTLQQWKNIPLAEKAAMLSVITGVEVWSPTPTIVADDMGTQVDPGDPDSVHMLLCQGVGEFMIQGWYEPQQRWLPEFPDLVYLTGIDLSFTGVWYPYRKIEGDPIAMGMVAIGGGEPLERDLFSRFLNEEHFNEIPGLGRALKFTFTLYDSKGIIKNGRTFSHIVYLDN